MFKKFLAVFLLLSMLFSLAYCEEKPIIAVSIVPEMSFVKNIAGDDFDIVICIPPGASPETYEPTPMDIENLNNALIYFAIGVQTEDRKILPFLNPKTKLVMLHEDIAKVYEEYKLGEDRDPHIWLSPKRVIVAVECITNELCAIKPEKADVYKANSENYIKQLKAVDEDIKQILSNLKNNKFIAFHPAFQYFAKDYGLEMFALEEHGKEATAHHLSDIIDISKAENIKVLFIQNEISSRQAEAFASEIGGKVVVLTPLSDNYIENLLHTARNMAEVLK